MPDPVFQIECDGAVQVGAPKGQTVFLKACQGFPVRESERIVKSQADKYLPGGKTRQQQIDGAGAAAVVWQFQQGYRSGRHRFQQTVDTGAFQIAG